MQRTIAEGSSAKFPVTGGINAFNHTPGAEIMAELIRGNERLITLEDLIIAPWFQANIDEMMNHFDMSQIAARAIGQALAKIDDQNISRTLSQASRGVKVIDDGYDGFNITDANLGTDGAAIWQAILNAAVRFDQIDAPAMDRIAALDPIRYALLLRSEKPMDRNLGNEGNGSLASGIVNQVAGIGIGKTNNLYKGDDRTNTAQPAARRLDYSTNVGQIFGRDAVGVLSLQDVTMESSYDPRRQGTLLLGKMLKGYGVLRPEESIDLRTAAPAA